jgi:sulfatase maturation enzyme AslB (radical SAM superfamily)|tara:strand:- start:3461 stop:4669 length:1209 start_codon:yes stop_codon:yes gene_type:complete
VLQENNGGIQLSKTFCPLPWTHLATHPHGSVTLCCESDMTNRASEAQNLPREFITLNNSTYDFEKIMNSDMFKQVRKDMLDGKMPSPCSKCYKLEALGNESKRTRDTSLLEFSLQDAQRITQSDGTLTEVNFEFIELRLGNICNLACRSCNPQSSSKWISDWEKLNDRKFDMPQSLFNWPLDEQFWANLAEHCNNTRKVYINGGEPLLVDKHMKFLEFLITKDLAKNITLVYSTNSTIINDKYIDLWNAFKQVEFMVSIDDLEDRNNYLRHPAKWDKILKSFEWLHSLGHKTYILQTISIMNIYYIKEFWEYFRARGVNVSHNMVHHPNYYSAANAPQHAKQAILNKIVDMPFYNQINNFLSQEDDPQAFEKFFDENKRLDVIRNQQYEEIFKEWHDKLLLR